MPDSKKESRLIVGPWRAHGRGGHGQAVDRERAFVEASEWLIILDEAGEEGDLPKAFLNWLESTPLHAEAFIEAQKIWQKFDDIACQWQTPAGFARANVMARKIKSQPNSRTRKKISPLLRPVAAIAASLLLVLGVLAYQSFSDRSGETYITHRGEYRAISLPDGSVVHLNAASKIRVDYNAKYRQLRLITGEATFQVATEASRPFIVEARNYAAMAIGTEFNINIRANEVELVVLEGTVKVGEIKNPTIFGRDQQASLNPTILHDHQKIRYDDKAYTVDRVPVKTIDRIQSWKENLIIFEDERLENVLSEMQRYTSETMLIANDKLKDMRISGVFSMNGTKSFITALESELPVRAIQILPNLILLVPA